jgi:AraC-like DNA-binding protein
MQKAKYLLETTFLGVKQIMAHVGMHDRSHFDREFKRVYDLTPFQYRRAAKLRASVKTHKWSR